MNDLYLTFLNIKPYNHKGDYLVTEYDSKKGIRFSLINNNSRLLCDGKITDKNGVFNFLRRNYPKEIKDDDRYGQLIQCRHESNSNFSGDYFFVIEKDSAKGARASCIRSNGIIEDVRVPNDLAVWAIYRRWEVLPIDNLF